MYSPQQRDLPTRLLSLFPFLFFKLLHSSELAKIAVNEHVLAEKTPRLFPDYNIAAFLAQRNWVFRLRDRRKTSDVHGQFTNERDAKERGSPRG